MCVCDHIRSMHVQCMIFSPSSKPQGLIGAHTGGVVDYRWLPASSGASIHSCWPLTSTEFSNHQPWLIINSHCQPLSAIANHY